MISTSHLHPSLLPTLGELRRLTADLPDETPLRFYDDCDPDMAAPAAVLETDALYITRSFEPCPET